jgi:hypothetical protein
LSDEAFEVYRVLSTASGAADRREVGWLAVSTRITEPLLADLLEAFQLGRPYASEQLMESIGLQLSHAAITSAARSKCDAVVIVETDDFASEDLEKALKEMGARDIEICRPA